uniref:Amc17 n=1 Tax=Streptomyces novoguineensis TaxID=2586640 RepID=A0A4Y5QSS8_9ACTN|nr:Amc17 [Streptomyces novoguineensis]
MRSGVWSSGAVVDAVPTRPVGVPRRVPLGRCVCTEDEHVGGSADRVHAFAPSCGAARSGGGSRGRSRAGRTEPRGSRHQTPPASTSAAHGDARPLESEGPVLRPTRPSACPTPRPPPVEPLTGWTRPVGNGARATG